MQNGALYKFWGLNERRAGNESMAENYFKYAKDVYNNISNAEIKEPLLADLSQVSSHHDPASLLPAVAVGEPVAR
jgi:hypothetical protein